MGQCVDGVKDQGRSARARRVPGSRRCPVKVARLGALMVAAVSAAAAQAQSQLLYYPPQQYRMPMQYPPMQYPPVRYQAPQPRVLYVPATPMTWLPDSTPTPAAAAPAVSELPPATTPAPPTETDPL